MGLFDTLKRLAQWASGSADEPAALPEPDDYEEAETVHPLGMYEEIRQQAGALEVIQSPRSGKK